MDARVLLYAMLKGGARKTTSAVFTAFALAEQGEEVLLVDADPYTQGATDWASRVYAAGGALPFHMMQWSHSAGLLVPFVQHAARTTGASRVIIDAAAESPEVVRQAAYLADLVISPTGPEQAELGRLHPTRLTIGAVDPAPPMAVLLTRVPQPGRGAAKAVREVLVADGYDVLPVEIPHSRDVYAHAFGTLPTDYGSYVALAAHLLAAEQMGSAA